ncbi:MAG: hypothetical protein NTX45_01635 [Proteobacteria bacterium]|nr:hypothetical protein [Pseudomonadota bacterium]
MTNFVEYDVKNPKKSAVSLSKTTTQTIDVGKTFRFGVIGANGKADGKYDPIKGLKIGPNDPSFGTALALPQTEHDIKNNITWFDLVVLRSGVFCIEAIDRLSNILNILPSYPTMFLDTSKPNLLALDWFQLKVTSNPGYYLYLVPDRKPRFF